MSIFFANLALCRNFIVHRIFYGSQLQEIYTAMFHYSTALVADIFFINIPFDICRIKCSVTFWATGQHSIIPPAHILFHFFKCYSVWFIAVGYFPKPSSTFHVSTPFTVLPFFKNCDHEHCCKRIYNCTASFAKYEMTFFIYAKLWFDIINTIFIIFITFTGRKNFFFDTIPTRLLIFSTTPPP